MSEFPPIYSNEEGDHWVPIADAPDEDAAGAAVYEFCGMPIYSDGKVKTTLSDCEEGHCCKPFNHSCEVHPDCPKKPCPTPRRVSCWHFVEFGGIDGPPKYEPVPDWDEVPENVKCWPPRPPQIDPEAPVPVMPCPGQIALFEGQEPA